MNLYATRTLQRWIYISKGGFICARHLAKSYVNMNSEGSDSPSVMETKLSSISDEYGGRIISVKDCVISNADELFDSLGRLLVQWTKEGVRGVWTQISLSDTQWTPVFAKLGFVFHHARSDQLVMTKWLPEHTANNLPVYPFTSVGVGGLVEDQQGNILLMKEKQGAYRGWKFPGGLADPGEDLFNTARREVEEETGIKCVGQSVLCFRHMHQFKWAECSDFYFVCHMNPDPGTTLEPAPSEVETASCRWFTRSEVEGLKPEEFSPFSRHVLGLLDEYKAKQIKLQPHEITSLKRRWNVFSVTKQTQM